jgi:hypothetical protein
LAEDLKKFEQRSKFQKVTGGKKLRWSCGSIEALPIAAIFY